MENQNLTLTKAMREIELAKEKEQWKNIKKDEVFTDIRKTRVCFHPFTSEAKVKKIDEKIKLLQELVNDKGYDTLQLALQMKDTDTNSPDNIDLIMGMSKIIDYLLNENQTLKKCCDEK